MRRMKSSKQPPRKGTQEEENLKVLANFFRESTAIMEAAIKKSHEKYPDLFKST